MKNILNHLKIKINVDISVIELLKKDNFVLRENRNWNFKEKITILNAHESQEVFIKLHTKL